MATVKLDMTKAFFGALANRNYDVCSRWAVARRVMQDGSSYSLEDYPYVEGILNSRAKKNWIMKAAQVGLSEAGITIAYFETDYNGRDVIYYFPTKIMGQRFSKTRFSQAITLSPYLSSVCTNNSVELKQFGNATINILGANSMTDLKGTASGRLVFDELDEWTEQQMYLAEERASGQKNDDTIIWGFSTPKFPNIGVHKQFLASTQEQYKFDCPHCKERIGFEWEDRCEGTDGGKDFGAFMLFGQSIDDPDVHKSYLKCEKCNCKLDHADKKNFLRSKTRGGNAEWEAQNPNADPTTSRGFYLPQMYSPTVAPYKLAIAFIRGYGDEHALREFHNSKLGLPYIGDAYQVNDQNIDDAVAKGGVYTMVEAAKGLTLDNSYVTLGIDQGGPVHNWAAVDWEFNVDKVGDPNDRAEGRLIGCGLILQDDWAKIHELMRRYLVRACVVDFFPQPTNARVFARTFNGYVHLCQYTTGRAGREVSLTEDVYGANMVKVNNVAWMSKALGRIIGGTMNLPADLPLAFRQQVKAPIRILKNVEGQLVAQFVETPKDHYAHAMTYAEIALKILDPSLHTSDVITCSESIKHH